VSVAVRLVPIGQSDGLAIIAALEEAISAAASQWQDLGLDAIGAVAYATDIAQMAHETLHTRIFRS
jgi:urease accessory protein